MTSRQARVKVDENEAGIYHLCSRVAGPKGWYPLAEPIYQKKLLDLIQFYAKNYQCKVYGFCIMGNHYHLIVEFLKPGKLPRKFLKEKANMFYPRSAAHIDLWNDDKWNRFEKRLFNVSEFMRSLNRAFTWWYNTQTNSRGTFWADRFKSVILKTPQALQECMLYIDLNPVRASLVQHPEDFVASSCHLRLIGKDKWLVDIKKIMRSKNRQEALKYYRQLLYERGALTQRPGKASISREVKIEMRKNDFRPRGVYQKKLKYFVNGVMMGSKMQIEDKIRELKTAARKFYYKRKIYATEHSTGDYTLQNQKRL
jgi:putative transposase